MRSEVSQYEKLDPGVRRFGCENHQFVICRKLTPTDFVKILDFQDKKKFVGQSPKGSNLRLNEFFSSHGFNFTKKRECLTIQKTSFSGHVYFIELHVFL